MTTKEDDVLHQGKTIDQWTKDFNGMFTYEQLLTMAKGGCDLQKLLVMGLDEADANESFKELPLDTDEGLNETSAEDEAAALNESIKPNYIVHVKVLGINTAFSVNAEDEADAEKQVKEQIKTLSNGSNPKVEIEKIESMKSLNESFNDNIVTTKDFVSAMKRNLADENDKIMFRLVKDKKPYEVFDMHSKGGTFVVDLIPVVVNDRMLESASWENSSGITDDQWNEAYKWFEANGFKIHDSDEGGFTFTKPINGKYFYPDDEGYKLYLSMKE